MKSKVLTLPSFAKINWFLHILGKRPDNYHELCTAFQTVSLCDKISFTEDEKLTLTSNDVGIPLNEDNLIIKAGNLLLKEFGIKKGAKIHLEKNIPFPGGLGGGSSNAAIAILGLATLWNLSIRFEELIEIGSQIGADVPFFFYGGTALGEGRGTEILKLNEKEEKFLIIITPNINISTAEAYSKLASPRLTKKASKSILKICRDEADELDSKQFELKNDFEKVIFKIEPEIKRLKNKLLEFGAKNALMSGSGASLFGIFDNDEKRQIALQAFTNEKNVRKFTVKTISRCEYRKFLEPCKKLLPKGL